MKRKRGRPTSKISRGNWLRGKWKKHFKYYLKMVHDDYLEKNPKPKPTAEMDLSLAYVLGLHDGLERGMLHAEVAFGVFAQNEIKYGLSVSRAAQPYLDMQKAPNDLVRQFGREELAKFPNDILRVIRKSRIPRKVIVRLRRLIKERDGVEKGFIATDPKLSEYSVADLLREAKRMKMPIKIEKLNGKAMLML